ILLSKDKPTNTIRNIVFQEILGVKSIKIVTENVILEDNAMEIDNILY
uniref:Uncharacterized protein n=1 Tax=Acrobeloides nanus TaxID=290746 RepID=A0A914DP60_9BILA